MSNVFHKNFTLDDNHPLHARVYADIAARDADTAFNTDSENEGKAVLVLSPASLFTLLTAAPLFLELSNTTAGDVTTSDVLVAGQLLLGNGTKDIVTEPDLSYTGTRLNLISGKGISLNGEDIITESGGENTLSNINLLDATTETAIEDAIDRLDNLSFIGGISGSITGPSGAWMDDGFNIGPGDMFSIDSVIVIDSDPVITLKNIAALDATTAATIAAAPGVGNVTTSDTLVAGQLLLGNGTTDIVTEPDLFWDGTHLGVRTSSPDTTVDIDGNATDALRLRSGNSSGFTRNQVRLSHDDGVNFTHLIKTRHNEFNQDGNAIDFFMWDADDQNPGDLGNLAVLTLKGDGKIGVNKPSPSGVVDILSLFGDTTAVIQMESTSNAGTVKLRTGNRDPNVMVTGLGPDVYYADRGVLSGTYENRSAGGDQIWLKRSVLPTNIIELHNSAELDDLASGGIITISENTTWHIRGPLTTANRIVVTGAFTFFHIEGEYNATASITYTGTDTFITSAGLVRIFAQVQLISSSTGTFMDVNGGSGVDLREIALIGWDDLGSVVNTGFFASETFFQNIGDGFTLTNNFIATVANLVLVGTALNGAFFTINTNNPFSVLSFTNVAANSLGASGSIFDLDTRINNNASIKINRCAVVTGNILKLFLVDATINSVADGSIATGAITAMADNGSGGTTISSTTTYFEDEETTISGTTSYNGAFQIFNVVAGVSFDTITPFVADDATGSVDTVRLTLTLAGGHGIITGDSLKIIDTNFYNGFETALNVATNDLTVNGVFISTNTGMIERDVSLDKTDPRVSAFNNFGLSDSAMIATGHVNDNSTATGTIVNNTFTDMVFGTVGAAIIANNTMERWRLVDEINGTFEYFGQEPFDGSITFDFTVLSSGGTVDFRFKWQIDEGSGFVDLPDNVESLVAVGSDSQSVTKTYPLAAVLGDRIKPQITRNSGTSGITSTFVTVYASM